MSRARRVDVNRALHAANRRVRYECVNASTAAQLSPIFSHYPHDFTTQDDRLRKSPLRP